jgi:hypothetical protein
MIFRSSTMVPPIDPRMPHPCFVMLGSLGFSAVGSSALRLLVCKVHFSSLQVRISKFRIKSLKTMGACGLFIKQYSAGFEAGSVADLGSELSRLYCKLCLVLLHSRTRFGRYNPKNYFSCLSKSCMNCQENFRWKPFLLFSFYFWKLVKAIPALAKSKIKSICHPKC